MKNTLTPLWLLSLGLAFFTINGVSAQTTETVTTETTISHKEKLSGTPTRKSQLESTRTVSEIEGDIKKIKLQIEEKKKIAGYNTVKLEEKLEQYENELKRAKHKTSAK